MFIYKVVGIHGAETFETVEELTRKYPQVGVVSSPSVRDELQGQPILEGLLGAMYDGMYDGKHVIRYETHEAYDMYSV